MAFLASFVTANGYAGLSADHSFLELQRQVLPQIGAALHTAAPPSAAACAEHVSEEFAKNVAEVLKHSGIESAARGESATHSGVTKAVIERSFLGVGEDGVGFAHFLELLLGVGIVRVPVRVQLQSKFAVGALQLRFGHRPAHTEDFIIVTFCVCGQNGLPTKERNWWDYFPGFFATFTIAGRNRRFLSMSPCCSSS